MRVGAVLRRTSWFLCVLGSVSATSASAQAPADAVEKARTLIREKWEARAAVLAKAADADRDGAVAETEFTPLWDAAEKDKHELVGAVCAASGIKAADPKKDSGAGGKGKKRGKKGKKGGKKGGGKEDPANEAEARKTRIAEAFRAADADADGKVAPAEAAGALLGIQADNEPIGG